MATLILNRFLIFFLSPSSFAQYAWHVYIYKEKERAKQKKTQRAMPLYLVRINRLAPVW